MTLKEVPSPILSTAPSSRIISKLTKDSRKLFKFKNGGTWRFRKGKLPEDKILLNQSTILEQLKLKVLWSWIIMWILNPLNDKFIEVYLQCWHLYRHSIVGLEIACMRNISVGIKSRFHIGNAFSSFNYRIFIWEYHLQLDRSINHMIKCCKKCISSKNTVISRIRLDSLTSIRLQAKTHWT